ncbi:MAG: acyl-CoA dehydrogenase [Woeseiaceae bacterium]|nr:acyl-CoA dehydrogenase [Woeseiaceae bacterium]
MEFSYTDVQSMLQESIEKFIANDYDFERRQQYAGSDLGHSPEVWSMFAELGWTAVPFAEEDGGFDGGPVEIMVMMQQFGRGLLVEPFLANVVLAGGVLRRAASDEQKERWLQPLIAGELQATLAVAEPQSRYELANVATTATRDGDGWVLNGHKGVVLNGGNAQLVIVPARSSGEQTDRSGITLFAVDATASGITCRDYPTVDGLRAAEVLLDGVRVDAGAVIGDVDGGYNTFEAVVDEATLAICAEAVGIIQVMTEKTVEYSKSRQQFGVPIGSFQALQHRAAILWTEIELAQSLVLKGLKSLDDDAPGEQISRLASAAKAKLSRVAQLATNEAIQMHGGIGMTDVLDMGLYLKRARVLEAQYGDQRYHASRFARLSGY